MKTYLALGDSMSIDDYTGVEGGGATKQFWRRLGDGYRLVDRTVDGCTMPMVPRDDPGDVVTLTIGGNDLLGHLEVFLTSGDERALGDQILAAFAQRHRELLEALRAANPGAVLIVGNIYKPDLDLPDLVLERLTRINAIIVENTASVGGRLADIHGAFAGNDDEFLTLQIEPTLAGATAIAGRFAAALGDDA